MFYGILILSLILITANSKTYKIPATNERSPIFLFSLGTPSQLFYTRIDFSLSSLVVIDSNCGQLTENCPEYCENKYFYQMYCDPMCLKVDLAATELFCPENPRPKSLYCLNDSNTAIDENYEWKIQVTGSRSLQGLYARDRLQIHHPSDNYKRKYHLLYINVENYLFVRGTLLDSRFKFQRIVLGMAPSSIKNDNFVMQTYEQKLIDKPIICFSRQKFANLYRYSMTLGDIDRKNCDQWAVGKSLSNSSWILNFKEIEIGGFKFQNNKCVISVQNEYDIYIPKEFGDKLVHEGILFYTDGQYYAIKNSTNISLIFTIESQKFIINPRKFDLEKNSTFMLSSYNIPTGSIRYTESSFWSFSFYYFQQFCTHFNYETMEFGFASMRN